MTRTTLTTRDGSNPRHEPIPRSARPPHPPRPPRIGTLWGYWSKHPAATVLWIVVIVLSFRTMPSANSAWPSGAPTGPGRSSMIPWANLVKRSGAIVAVASGKEQPTDTVLGAAWFDYRLRPEFEGSFVTITGSGITPADMAPARAAYITWLAAQPEPYWQRVAAGLSPGDHVNTLGFRWRRIGQSIVGLLIGPALLLRSLMWAAPIFAAVSEFLGRMSPDPIERERRRRRRALSAGKCPGCGYNITGLPHRRCPECNETWGSSELSI